MEEKAQHEVVVWFANHFDLVWRRCWERPTLYLGRRYASYREVETWCIERNLTLAEAGKGAYMVEQTLSLRAYLETHPDELPRFQALYAKGLFELLGAGEAIIDVNMASIETICRNLGSGVRYARDLGMPPELACHNDGFGSSAQFPQVIRCCGLDGIAGLSYSEPDNLYWRGLDGSALAVVPRPPGRFYFYDHCYHEPCRQCRGEGCDACEGMGIDLPQNTYPPFEPATGDDLADKPTRYGICSEEMLPPDYLNDLFAEWQAAHPEVQYRWGTQRLLAEWWEELLAAVDDPPADQVASRVENNPVQTGCYVSRIRSKLLARRCEAVLYGWEIALATAGIPLEHEIWSRLFRELPLFFFHDSVTGTHQDEAHQELLDRMTAMQDETLAMGLAALGAPEARLYAGAELQVFTPATGTGPHRVRLPVADWRDVPSLEAIGPDGRRFPVVYPWHHWSPPLATMPGRLVTGVGSGSRCRPETGEAYIEVDDLTPLAWTQLVLSPAHGPRPLETDTFRNEHLRVILGEHGVKTVRDLASGAEIDGESCTIGGLLLDEDVGDPWGTRELPTFRRELAPYTHLLSVSRFRGYTEAVFAGRYDPNLRFGREQDPAMFALEWQLTYRLIDGARRLDVEVEVLWQSTNRRLRIAFPTQAPTDEAWYSIPGGWLSRPRYEQTETCLWSPNGDWPALHTVATRPGDTGTGWAVINYGTPAARVEDGRVLVSFLRSPGSGHCLQRYAQEYPMPTSGIRDGGWHHFTFSLMAHDGEADMPCLMSLASRLNQAPPAAGGTSTLPGCEWALIGDGIELTAAKQPFGPDESGLIVRLVNLSSAPNHATLRLPATIMRVRLEGITEDVNQHLLVENGSCRLDFGPFEIKTLRIG